MECMGDWECLRFQLIQMLFSSDTYSKFKSHATEPVDSSNKYYFDSSKVESHYAIVPTSKKLSLGQMSDDEKKLYDMIARSVICICYPKAQLSKTNIITENQERNLQPVVFQF